MTKMTENELITVLRALERKGMIESRIIDGEVQWRITAKGRAIRDGEADLAGGQPIRIGLVAWHLPTMRSAGNLRLPRQEHRRITDSVSTGPTHGATRADRRDQTIHFCKPTTERSS
jgi:hypothetical protein